MQIRKIRNANQDDNISAKVIVNTIDIVRIVNPIDRGLMAKISLVDAINDRDIKENRSIYNYESCTHSISFKGLCALYTYL